MPTALVLAIALCAGPEPIGGKGVLDIIGGGGQDGAVADDVSAGQRSKPEPPPVVREITKPSDAPWAKAFGRIFVARHRSLISCIKGTILVGKPLRLSVVIDERGRVDEVEVGVDANEDPTVVERVKKELTCMGSRIMRWRFPREVTGAIEARIVVEPRPAARER